MGGSQGKDRGHGAGWVFEGWVHPRVITDSGYGSGHIPGHLNSALVSGKEQFKEMEDKLGGGHGGDWELQRPRKRWMVNPVCSGVNQKYSSFVL